MKKYLLYFFLFHLIIGQVAYCQVDTTQTSNNLLEELNTPEQKKVELLPKKMLFTQSLLWGQNGLIRKNKAFQLSPDERVSEMKIRRKMLQYHQIAGITTLVAMLGEGIIGMQLYNGDRNIRDLHEGVAAAVNIGYITTACLSFFAPPKMIDERKGYSSIKVHKALAFIHIAGMLATNILASQVHDHPELKPYHRDAAMVTFAALTASMVVIKF